MAPPFLFRPYPVPYCSGVNLSPRTLMRISTAFSLIRTLSLRFSLFPPFSVFCFGLTICLPLLFPTSPRKFWRNLLLQPVPLFYSPLKAPWVLSSSLQMRISSLSEDFPGLPFSTPLNIVKKLRFSVLFIIGSFFSCIVQY